eukprot:GHUV01042875.1.p1 GENE.GHUV01042875.1~~GHUV01042875.1.p1  ORF type:complete len:116 (+),score=28.89 GHUV01042875.1:22-369(+)
MTMSSRSAMKLMYCTNLPVVPVHNINDIEVSLLLLCLLLVNKTDTYMHAPASWQLQQDAGPDCSIRLKVPTYRKYAALVGPALLHHPLLQAAVGNWTAASSQAAPLAQHLLDPCK